jgi:hypothetical protein
MSLLPMPIPQKTPQRFEIRLMQSSWRVIDTETGELAGRARYTVEIQAQFAAETLNWAYEMGKREGAKMGVGG